LIDRAAKKKIAGPKIGVRMKRTLLALSMMVWITLPARHGAAAETSSTTKNLTTTSSNTVLQDALALVEIYYKIRSLAGQNETSQLQPQLQRLNLILDKVIAFKASFTPEKRNRIERDLNEVKKELASFADLAPSEMKSNLPRLTDRIWKLARVLLE
jgi:hypothetical protein